MATPILAPQTGVHFSGFRHPGVVLVHSGDTGHCAGYWDEQGIGIYQSDNGPSHLVVGHRAGEDQLQRAARRYRIDIADLRAFRDGCGPRREAVHVPADLFERFSHFEGAVFEVLRTEGETRLWKSTTQDHERHGRACKGSVRFHVSTGDEGDYMLMPSLESALANFELAAAEAEVRKLCH